MSERNYDSTIARMAGNIAGAFAAKAQDASSPVSQKLFARWSVEIAREIVAEIRRTEPEGKS